MPAGDLTLRELQPGDRPAIARILQASGTFQDTEVAIGLELVDESLNPGPSTDYAWFIAEHDGRVVGFACYGPVPLTVGTFDLYWWPRGSTRR
jgi:predicted N-acetyltransferase YhbS